MKFPLFIVFDLDGTLADTSHRAHYLTRPYGEKDWRGFFAACDKDRPHNHVIAVLRALVAAGHDVEIWSGRSDEVRDKTEIWLREHGLDAVPLRMRKAGDHTADEVLKRSWIAEASRKPDMIFDDRAKVVAMWRAEGIPCLQVAPGDF